MTFSAPPEMTTAITDGIFGLVAVFLGYKLKHRFISDKQRLPLRIKMWQIVFYTIGASALFGVPAHAIHEIAGTNPPNIQAQTYYWIFLGFFLGLMITALASTVLLDLFGERAFRKSAIIMIVTGIGYFFLYFITAFFKLIEGYFIIFVLYSALVMLFALVSYIVLFFQRTKTGYMIIALGIVVAISGSILQALRTISINVIWEFDYNSIYHIFMIAAVILFYYGIIRSDDNDYIES